MKDLSIYTGPQCHLCDQAKKILLPLLSARGWKLIEKNIQGKAALIDAYGLRIPVVVFPSGREKGWPFTTAQIVTLLDREL
jgi:hypothetical protein